MRTTQDHAKEERRDSAPIARATTEALLRQRECLPHAENGRPIPPSNPVAAQIRKDMQQGRSAEVRRLLTVLACDLADGVPLPTVLTTLRQMEAYLTLCADDMKAPPRDLAVFVRRETIADGRKDLAELKVLDTPNSPEALLDLIHCANEYEMANADLLRNVHARLAIVRTSESCRVSVSR